MDNPILLLLEATKQVNSNIADTTYEELEQFIDQREKLIVELDHYFQGRTATSEEKQQLETILNYDNLIRNRMVELKNEAAKWLAQRNSAKSQRNAYEAGYATESILMDHKK